MKRGILKFIFLALVFNAVLSSYDEDYASRDEGEDRSNGPPRWPISKNTPRICLGNRIATPAELRRFGRYPNEIACIRDVIKCKRGYRFTTEKERSLQTARGLKKRYCIRTKPKKEREE